MWSRSAAWSEAWCAARVVAKVERSASIWCLISRRATEVAAERAEREDLDDAWEWWVRWERWERVDRMELVALMGAG